MRLLRFVSDKEMQLILDDEIIKKKNQVYGSSTLRDEDIIYFLDLKAADKYMEEAGALPPGDQPDTEQRIMFYDLLLAGVPDTHFAVIIEKSYSEVKIGYGTYGHPGYLYDDPDIGIDDTIQLKEVGVSSYSLDDIIEIWENDGRNNFDRIK